MTTECPKCNSCWKQIIFYILLTFFVVVLAFFSLNGSKSPYNNYKPYYQPYNESYDINTTEKPECINDHLIGVQPGCVQISDRGTRCFSVDLNIFKMDENQNYLQITNMSNSTASFYLSYDMKMCLIASSIVVNVPYVNVGAKLITVISSVTTSPRFDIQYDDYEFKIDKPYEFKFRSDRFGIRFSPYPFIGINQLKFEFKMPPGTSIGVSHILMK
jgi:hypothetical protein